jgi:predicted Zn-dependent protease
MARRASTDVSNPIQQTERIYLKLVLAIVGGIVLVALLGWGGVRAYHSWQERHLVRRAAGFLSGGNVKTAALSARRALQLNPESADAARMMADIAERVADGSELAWRRQVHDLVPGSIDDALALVRAALRANDLPLAERTLESLAKKAESTAAFHAARGRLAEMRNKPADAETHWARAAELAPHDTAYQVQLAMVQLGSADKAKRERALAALDQLRSDPKQRAAATRALIIDGGTRGADPQRMRALASDLQSYPDVVFSDRLIYIEILRQLRDPAYDDYLAQLERDALGTAADTAGLLTWMAGRGNVADAVRFAATIPTQRAEEWPVPLALAETYAKAGDWAAVQRVAGEKSWSAYDFLRNAYLTRAFRGEGRELEAHQRWAQAQKEAAPQPQAILLLARTISGWGWEKETVDLLWMLSKAQETRVEALQLLYQNYAKNADTGGVYRVLLQSTEITPEDLTMQNNLAQVSLLLNADPERARKTAADLVRKEPGNAAFVSTYAFSLYVRGDAGAALQEMEKLSPEQLQEPPIAAYYGMMLAAAGQKEKARAYLERGAQAFLLPEEKALLAKAEAAVR